MDISSAKWLSELEMDDEYNLIHQCQMNSLNDNEFTKQDIATALGGGGGGGGLGENKLMKQSLSSESYSTTSNNETSERPAKQLKTATSWNSGTLAEPMISGAAGAYSSSSSTSQVLSFGNSRFSPPSITNSQQQQFYGNLNYCIGNPEDEATVYNGNMNFQSMILNKSCSFEDQKYVPKVNQNQGIKRDHPMARTAQDHIMAERRRREKLSQRFIALSAIVPGLKKMDKASVLGDAIKYLKQLQERVNVLEEQTKKRTVESVIFPKKSQLFVSTGDEGTSTSNENYEDDSLPEIEARVSDKNVLLRIHCEKNKGFAVKVLSEIEKLQLTVVNSSVLPFGNHAIDITVVAQMDDEFSMTVKDLVKNLRLAFINCM